MTQNRKEDLVNGETYHIYTRSIVKYIVFNDENEYNRMFQLFNCVRYKNFTNKLSRFTKFPQSLQNDILNQLRKEGDLLVDIISFCIMPTHIHIALKQISDSGISKFMSRVLNGYSRYFNTKHARTGPLWSSRFKSVLVDRQEQLLHLTRYIHLNPTSAGLVNKPEEWRYSSYGEYIHPNNVDTKICNYRDLIDLEPIHYQNFVNDRKDYKQNLSIIKHQLIDDSSA